MMVLIADDDPDWTRAASLWMQGASDTKKVKTKIYHGPEELVADIEQATEIAPGTVVFLDLDFSVSATSGLDTLEIMKEHANERIRKLPVIIYSRSDSPNEITQSYERKANSFVSKGKGNRQKGIFLKTVRFWMKTAKLPSYSE